MRSSIDQVVDVLKGWRDDRRTVAVVLTSGKDDFVKFGGAVTQISPISVQIFGNDFGVDIKFPPEAEFDWQDPRESPAESREEAIRLYEAFLEIRAPSYRCLLFSFKRKDERVDK